MSTTPFSKEIKIKAVVTNIIGNRLIVKTNSAAQYDAETANAQLLRKNGAAMQYSEISVGDKVEIWGKVWNDNSINAALVKNLSLYPHSGTFSGKILGVDAVQNIVQLQNALYGVQKIYIDRTTIFAAKQGLAGWDSLQPGVKLKVKGVWEKNRNTVHAKHITISLRLINIDITGTLVIKNEDALTVVTQTVIYGVTAKDAVIVNKKNVAIPLSALAVGTNIRVWGKHIPEGQSIIAKKVKQLDV